MIDSFSLDIGAATIAMEAGGESYKGMLGVGWVLHSRQKRHPDRSLIDICFWPWQFSAWNTDSPTRLNLDKMSDLSKAASKKAILGAVYELELDPTNGAIFYLNKKVVLATAGKLPDWWDIDGDAASEIEIGLHSFRKHI